MSTPEPIRDPILERPLPSSPDTERALLGAVVLNNALIAEAIETLGGSKAPGQFYVPSHRRVFMAMVAIFERGEPIDPIMLAHELRKDNSLESTGGVLFLTNLTYGLPHVTSVAAFAKIIRGKSLLRQLVRVANKISAEALEEEDEPQNILDHAEHAIFALSDERRNQGRAPVSMKQGAEMARNHLNKLNLAAENPAIETPWNRLNAICRGGLNPTELWGLLGPEKMGKSVAAKQLAVHAARKGHRVLYFSREMSVLKIFYRALATVTDIPASQIRYGLGQGLVERSITGTKELEGLGIFIDDYTSDIEDIWIKTREMVRLENVDMIVGDYANQISARKVRKSANRAEEVAMVWRGFKNVSQEFNITSLVLGHPTTEYQKRAEHKKPGERKAPFFNESAESKEAVKAVDVGIVLWTDLTEGQPGARPARFYVDYQRDEDAGGSVPLIFKGRISEFHEPKDDRPPGFADWND